MIANYHTHTVRCGHAAGTEEEYVLAGIQAGLKVLGFADHSPFPFEGGAYSHIRMRPDELQDYARQVLTLREKYKDVLQIPLGVEIEYFPRFWKEQLAMLRDCGIEYLLLGQHWSEYVQGGHYNGTPTDREELLEQYCRTLREGMQTGAVSYIAHPDLFHFIGDEKIYQAHMRVLCADARACNVPLEINLLGLGNHRHYPNRRFWELAGEKGCQVVLGMDAHTPEALLDTAAEAAAMELAQAFGLKVMETVPLQIF